MNEQLRMQNAEFLEAKKPVDYELAAIVV